MMLTLCSCREKILHDLSEQDANRIITRLAEHNIEGTKELQPDARWAVQVGSEDIIPALRYIDDRRIIQDRGLDNQKKSSVVSSREDQRFSYERALSREIERTIAAIDGVLETRVHLNLPVVDPIFGQPVASAATGSGSVLMVTTQDFAISKEALAQLVMGASGISAQNISILITKGEGELQHPVAKQVPVLSKSETPSTHPTLSRQRMIELASALLILVVGGTLLVFKAIRRRRILQSIGAKISEAQHAV